MSAVAWATGIARSRVNRGSNDLEAFGAAREVWRAGGGRPLLTETDPMLLEDMQRLLPRRPTGKVEASVARRLRTPPKSANP